MGRGLRVDPVDVRAWVVVIELRGSSSVCRRCYLRCYRIVGASIVLARSRLDIIVKRRIVILRCLRVNLGIKVVCPNSRGANTSDIRRRSDFPSGAWIDRWFRDCGERSFPSFLDGGVAGNALRRHIRGESCSRGESGQTESSSLVHEPSWYSVDYAVAGLPYRCGTALCRGADRLVKVGKTVVTHHRV